MAVLPTGIGPVTGNYQIERSLRFNSADTAYLNRTPSSAGNRKTWTWSGWAKRSKLGAQQGLIGCSVGTSDSTYMNLQFNSGDLLGLGLYTQYVLLTTQVFRDTSAWYHIVVSFDTTNATANSRCRMYINGAEITTFTTRNNPTLNADYGINAASQHDIGRSEYTNSTCLGGYLTEVNFIDGQALTPSSFGETDSNTGVWKPKAYTGTYGTNGFYLKFADNSNTTAATLGKDSSGNGNNWTPNNFSVTAGAGNDSLVDSPTSYGTDTGVGGEVRGNYATFNPNDYQGSTGLSNGNLDVSGISVGNFGTTKVTSGKWYFEFTKNANGDNQLGIASGNIFQSASNFGVTCFRRAWRDNAGSPVWVTDGSNAGSGTAQSLATGDILGVAVDLDNNAVYFAKNNTWMNSGVPTSGASKTGAIWTDLSGGLWQIYAGGNANGCYTSVNTGQRAFAYTAPSGFKALCTQNLPTPTIGATSTTQANDYFNAVLYTGTGSSLGVTGVGFQPDWVWIKGRSGATDHGLYDAVRGVQKQLESNTITAETTETTGLTAFGTDGFTVGALAQLNTSSATYVAWNWNAGGSTVTNTSGTISAQVRANTTSGFSIVTYTGNGSSGATIGHGLGAVPSFYIVKNRGSANKDWECYHISLGNTNRIRLNQTAAADTGGTMWANTTPTSTVFSVGSDADVNASTNTYVAYCFAPVAGYSAFGSFTGNGSTDGPFVFANHRPAFLLVKRTDTISDWTILDFQREGYNVDNDPLFPNLTNAEGTTDLVDLLSNGFKLRSTDASVNASGGTYIYMSLASNPFKFSLAR